MSRIDTETLGRVHWRVAAAVTMAPQLQLNGRRKKPTMADHLIAGSSRRKLGGMAIFFFFPCNLIFFIRRFRLSVCDCPS